MAGIKCQPGRAVYFDAENSRREVKRRLRASGITAALAPAVYDCAGLDFQGAAAKFKATILHNGARLAVFDSLRAFAPGARENESDDMGALIRRFVEIGRATGCAVIVIHHRPKAEGGPTYRGSSSIRDQTDLMVVLERKTDDPDKKVRRRLGNVKCRIDEEPEDRWIELQADRGAGRVTLAPVESFGGDGRCAPKQTAAEDALVAALCSGPYKSRAAWIRAAGGDHENGTWKMAAAALIADGRAAESEAGITTPGTGQSVNPPTRRADCPAVDQGAVAA